ncbi:MAG: nucleotidyltransferase domain-containing protein [Candidatus Peribacteraceae bacterium]|nr:nucleotidyltransferase domain-containing protein [Candidatus Peribacteraceae bacterium]
MVIKVNDTDLKILSLFTKGYDNEFYIREVEKLLHVSSRTAFVTLAKLEKRGILESKIRGKIKSYSINNSSLSREFFLLTEQYKKIQFLEKNHLIKEVLDKADEFMQGIVIIFGSFAKGIQKDDSDLDLFIVGKYDEEKIKEAGKNYGIDINIKSYPKKIFEKELHDDFLLKEILENHFLIKGAEGFVRRVTKWIK